MVTIDHAQIVVCPHCESRVILTPILICPNCRIIIQEGGRSEGDSALIIDDYAEPATQPEVDEDISDEAEELAPVPPADPTSVELYNIYRSEAQRINRLSQLTFLIYASFGLVFLAAAGAFGYNIVLGKSQWDGLPALGVGLGLAALLITAGAIQAKRAADQEVESILIERPRFDLFYDLYRPQLRSRVWQTIMDNRVEAVFLAIVGKTNEKHA